MTDADDEPPLVDDLLMFAWGLIANAGEGDWSRESEEWDVAAKKWHDQFHVRLDIARKQRGAITQLEVLSGTPLSGGDFVVKLSTTQISLIAWALQSQANSLLPSAWGYVPSQQLASAFASLSGDH